VTNSRLERLLRALVHVDETSLQQWEKMGKVEVQPKDKNGNILSVISNQIVVQ
jgi:hypothetical protein